MSRPKIRAILKNMKDSLENDGDEAPKKKVSKMDNEGKRLLLASIG